MEPDMEITVLQGEIEEAIEKCIPVVIRGKRNIKLTHKNKVYFISLEEIITHLSMSKIVSSVIEKSENIGE
jgi:hypothetical protein